MLLHSTWWRPGGTSAECLLQYFLAARPGYSTPRHALWHTLDLVWANWSWLQSRCKNNLILTLHVASTRASIGNWRCLQKGGKGSASLFPFWFTPVSYYYYYFILFFLCYIYLFCFFLRPCPLSPVNDIRVPAAQDSGFCSTRSCSGKSIAPNTKCCCCHYAAAEVWCNAMLDSGVSDSNASILTVL